MNKYTRSLKLGWVITASIHRQTFLLRALESFPLTRRLAQQSYCYKVRRYSTKLEKLLTLTASTGKYSTGLCSFVFPRNFRAGISFCLFSLHESRSGVLLVSSELEVFETHMIFSSFVLILSTFLTNTWVGIYFQFFFRLLFALMFIFLLWPFLLLSCKLLITNIKVSHLSLK